MSTHPLSESLRSAAIPFLCSRIIFTAVVIACAAFSLDIVPAREGLNYHLSVGSYAEFVERLRKIFYSADGSWYLGIATRGYERAPFTAAEAKNWVFFPLYPLFVAAAGAVVPKVLTVAVLLNALFFLGGLTAFHNLALRLGCSRKTADAAIWLTALFPTSLFFSAPVSEALFFFLLVSVFLLLQSGRARTAGIGMLFLSACRPTGLLLFPAFAAAIFSRPELRLRDRVIALVAAPVGGLMFMAYLAYICGNPLAFIDNQGMWGRETDIVSALFALSREIAGPPVRPWNFVILNGAYLILGIAAAVHFLRRRNLAYALVILIPFASAAATGTLLSIGRYAVTLFPIFLAGAAWTAGENRERIVLSVEAALFALYCAGYALHVTAAMA